MHIFSSKTYFGFFGIILLLVGCGHPSSPEENRNEQVMYPGESWTEHTQQFNTEMIRDTEAEKIQLFVYRMPSLPANSDAVNIYIDGSYLTSLHENRFKEITLCTGKHTINAQLTKQDPAYYKKHTRAQELEFSDAGYVFLQVSVNNNQPVFSIEQPDQAIRNLEQTYRQTHALSRTKKSTINCTIPRSIQAPGS